MDLRDLKKDCRRWAKEAMAALTDQDLAGRGRAWAGQIESLEEFQRAKTVFCYLSVGNEPDTYPIIARALALGKVVCTPVCVEKGVMRPRKLGDLQSLVPGAYGIPVPPEQQPWVEPGEIDLVLVPCAACGQDGTRLGHGAGFYDRFLSGGKGARVALCHEELLLPTVPTGHWDEKMDAIVTQSRVLRFARK